jgi:hypothetical protein
VSEASRLGTVSEVVPDGWAAPDATARRVAPALIGSTVCPAPTEDEAAAILAATEVLWPKPVVIVAAARHGQDAWRFSGRWWARPISVRRPRPWY